MEPLMKVQIIYSQPEITVRITPVQACSSLSEKVPLSIVSSMILIQKSLESRLLETTSDLILHNSESMSQLSEALNLMMRYPELVKSIYDDLMAIQRSLKRMKQKLGLS
jgi:hypothetical protein